MEGTSFDFKINSHSIESHFLYSSILLGQSSDILMNVLENLILKFGVDKLIFPAVCCLWLVLNSVMGVAGGTQVPQWPGLPSAGWSEAAGFQSVCVMRVGATGASVIAPDRGGPRRLAFSQSSFNRGETRYSNSRDFYQRRTRLLAMPNKCFATRSRQPNKRNEKILCASRGRFRSSSVNAIRREGRKLGRTTSTRKHVPRAHHMLTGLVCISHLIKVTAENSIAWGIIVATLKYNIYQKPQLS
jgi:hypothetical protein